MYPPHQPRAKKRGRKFRKQWDTLVKIKNRMEKYIHEFGELTSLHGIKYVILPNNHFIETLLWAVILVLATTGAMFLIVRSYQRYDDNPTVVSLEKNFRDWNITFPASTVCFLERVNESLLADYLMTEFGLEENSTDYTKYKSFLTSVTNLTYENLIDFKQFQNEPALEKLGRNMPAIYRRTATEMTYHATVFNPAYNFLVFHETLTELGVCHTFAGVVPNFVTLLENPKITNFQLPACNYLNSLCYTRIEDLPTIMRYYVHSPYEIPDSSEKFFAVQLNMERDTAFKFQETVASNDLRGLEPRQRRCRFYDEFKNDRGLPSVYSYNLCRMDCRKQLAYKLCGCAPYFYLKERKIPVCNVDGLVCLSQYEELLTRLQRDDGTPVECNCLSQCESVMYYIDKDTIRSWSYPVPCNIRYRWAIENFNKTRHRRDIIFGFEDLLVSLGGTAAFFLGCSVLTFVELVYFFTLRLFWYIVRAVCK